MIGNKIGRRLDPYITTLLKTILGNHGNPNLFTLMGFFATLLASFLIIEGVVVLGRVSHHSLRTL